MLLVLQLPMLFLLQKHPLTPGLAVCCCMQLLLAYEGTVYPLLASASADTFSLTLETTEDSVHLNTSLGNLLAVCEVRAVTDQPMHQHQPDSACTSTSVRRPPTAVTLSPPLRPAAVTCTSLTHTQFPPWATSITLSPYNSLTCCAFAAPACRQPPPHPVPAA